MKLLATSDIHIGREPTNVPGDARKKYRTASIWEKIVNCAIEEKVDGLLIAGDIIDSRNKFFESIGPLEKGLSLLFDHQIPLFAIAGNHDYDVLPRIHASLKNPLFHLLGTKQQWDVVVHQSKSGRTIQIVGYSFTQLHMETSPLKTFPQQLLNPNIPTIGLLHTDFEIPNSLYCPTTKPELRATGVPLWIFGHIHKPEMIHFGENACAIYPGSPQGMDPGPGETGAHGPWIVNYEEINPTLTQIPLAPLRYDHLEIDVTGVQSIGELQQLLHEKISENVASILVNHSTLRYLSLRLHLVGTTQLRTNQIEEQIKLLEEGSLQVSRVTIAVNKATIQISPEIDLNTLSEGDDFKGQLAKFILQLNTDAHRPFLNEMMALSKQIVDENPFAGNEVIPPEENELKELLCCQAMELLSILKDDGG